MSIFVAILQVLKFEFQKFRIFEILNFHPCCIHHEYSLTVKEMTKHHLELLNFIGGCTALSEFTMSCQNATLNLKPHVAAHPTFLYCTLVQWAPRCNLPVLTFNKNELFWGKKKSYLTGIFPNFLKMGSEAC